MIAPQDVNKGPTPEFLIGGGEMGQRIRDFDWSKTSIGPVERWPKSLQTCIRIMLTSRQPIWIGWGRELIKFYNDPYKQIVGGKHPGALGQPASVVWREIWKDVRPMLKTVMDDDEGTYVEEQLLIMERNGYPEETYYTFSYTPIPDDDGGTAGMICANTDDTDRIISERQLTTVTTLGKALNEARSEEDVYRNVVESLSGNPYDFPFAILYTFAGDRVVLAGTNVPSPYLEKVPRIFHLKDTNEVSRIFSQALSGRKKQLLEELQERFGKMPSGAWEKQPGRAIILPLFPAGQKEAYGFLVVGLNPYRLLDETYENFFDLIADQITTSLTNVHALEEERKRLEALAELDKAKTTFFSNISHEFRTPLTLLLGPIQDALNDPEKIHENRARLEVAYRNALRMQKLVNMLLDFSRIEAGRMNAQFTPVDLSSLTRDLASTFRSAVERSGMKYNVHCEPLNEPVYVDTEMWEKIVLNLISNAFKYTTEGSITVALTLLDHDVELSVSDTGTGISEDELERIFERFHRAQNVRGRTQEGTGIGLAMVKELVKLHKGSITVSSRPNEGSRFAVRLPRGRAHIDPKELVINPGTLTRQSDLANTFLHEAEMLINDNGQSPTPKKAKRQSSDKPPLKVLVADDNPDMQGYIIRLLEQDYDVISATNGKEALDKLHQEKPSLVISDIMMPVMDGFGLLSEIRANPDIRNTPVIFLSARAGEESKVDGLNAGADDYLVKPFSSRELLAKVSSHIRISQARQKNEAYLLSLFNLAPVAITILRGENFFVDMANDFYLSIIDRDKSFIGRPIFDSLPELKDQGIPELLMGVLKTGKPFVGTELPIQLEKSTGLQTLYFNFVYHPLVDDNGTPTGIIVVANDVTTLVVSRQAALETAISLEKKVAERTVELQTQKDFAEAVMQSSEDLMMVFDTDLKLLKINEKAQKVYGLTASTSLGKTVSELLPSMRPEDMSYIHEALNGRVQSRTYRDDSIGRYFETFLIPLKTAEGKTYAVLATAHDVTEIIRASEQIRVAAEQLEKANESLIRKNTELEQFAYVSSHDLQEPLRKIQTFTEMIMDNFSDQEYVKKYLGKIDLSASRMSTLIKAVLQYSKLTNEEQKSERVPLNEVLKNVITDFELMIHEKNALLEYDILPEVRGNKLQFHQLFSNLIGNSLKFCEENPLIRISYQSAKGSDLTEVPGLDEETTYTVIRFEDNGIGFEDQFKEQIFGLFNRLHNRKDYSGTGIGLALCKKIVENHNGIIRASSTKNRGATFEIFLPAIE